LSQLGGASTRSRRGAEGRDRQHQHQQEPDRARRRCGHHVRSHQALLRRGSDSARDDCAQIRAAL